MSMRNKAKVYKIYNHLLRFLIIAATYVFLYLQLFRDRRMDEVLPITAEGYSWAILAVVLLMAVNWGLEASKWQMLIQKAEKISWLRSYGAVLSGISVSIFTPNRTGEYLGRVFALDRANRIEGILITISGSLAQITVTLAAGFCGLFFAFLTHMVAPGIPLALLTGVCLLMAAGALLAIVGYLNLPAFRGLLQHLFRRNTGKYSPYLDALTSFPSKILTRVLLLSIGRYFVFSLQFYILLRMFSIPVTYFPALMIISVIYLVMLAIPSIALLEIGIRGSVAVYLFGVYFSRSGITIGNYETEVLSATILLWLINLVIPALAGTFFVYSLKFFRK
jgi:uncharacterized membrane protein YbhN (UPF0104 family)